NLAELATRLGKLVSRVGGSGRFVTGFLGCLDPATGELEYVNAGHPSPLLVEGAEVRELPGGGLPFGVLPDYVYTSEMTTLRPGEMLALFSDGIPEAQRGDDFFDDDRVRSAAIEAARCAGLEAARRMIVGRVAEFQAGAPRS